MASEAVIRNHLVGMIFTLFGLIIIGRLVQLQVYPQKERVEQEVDPYTKELIPVFLPRGNIYDRSGHLLAGNRQLFEVSIDLSEVESPETIASVLHEVLGLDYQEIYKLASGSSQDGRVSVVVARNVAPETAEYLRQMQKEMRETYPSGEPNTPSLAGLHLFGIMKRYYPDNSLAYSVLGYVDEEGEGHYGVEEYYDELLGSLPQILWIRVPKDPYRVDQFPEIGQNADIILTIDRELQTGVEEILFDAVQANGAASGTIVVLDPRNGEILAMASTPEFNPNEYWRLLEIFTGNMPFNRAVSQAYEPGSVFKVLTMAAALDSGTVTPETTFLDQGAIEVGGRIIRNWDKSAWGQQTMLGCLQHSLNVCLAWVATQVGPSTYYDYLNRFGIGQRTWVDIAFEAQGRIRLPNKDPNWTMSDLGTNAFGQSVAVTPLQLAIAISAVPNDGEMMTPHVVWAIIKDGVQYQTPLRSLGQPISQETAKTLNEMLALSLEEESSSALVTGYRVAGKTGTAQIPIPGGFDPQLTNASFVGWGPVDDPRFLVFVWLEKPRTSPWGSVVAAPVFREVVERLVVYLNLPPDDVRRKMAEQVR